MTRFPHCLEKNLSPKPLSHSTGLFDYSASSLKPNSFTQKHFYTRILHPETLLHRDAVTHSAFDTTHKRFYTQTLLHTDPFTRRPFYTQKLVHTDPFTHKFIDRETLLHTRFYILTSSHRDVVHTDPLSHATALFDYSATSLKPNSFTQKRFHARSPHTETLLHRNAFTHKPFYTTHKRFCTQTLLHTNISTEKHFYTQMLLHTNIFTQRRVGIFFTFICKAKKLSNRWCFRVF